MLMLIETQIKAVNVDTSHRVMRVYDDRVLRHEMNLVQARRQPARGLFVPVLSNQRVGFAKGTGRFLGGLCQSQSPHALVDRIPFKSFTCPSMCALHLLTYRSYFCNIIMRIGKFFVWTYLFLLGYL